MIIPDTVTAVDAFAFCNCYNLKAVTLPKNSKVISKSLFAGIGYVTIPAGVTKIESEAFFGCAGLNAITIPESVTKIGEGAFEGCNCLTVYAPHEQSYYGIKNGKTA